MSWIVSVVAAIMYFGGCLYAILDRRSLAARIAANNRLSIELQRRAWARLDRRVKPASPPPNAARVEPSVDYTKFYEYVVGGMGALLLAVGLVALVASGINSAS